MEDIASLVKYCSMETGLKILNSQSLRWSAPHLFNDPYEPDYLSGADFSPEVLLSNLVKHAISLLFGRDEPSGKSNKLVAAIARWRQEERFASEEEAEEVLKQLLGQMAIHQQKDIDQYLNEWRKFASQLRICCFSDKPNNAFSWQRFSDQHRGIALRFSCGDDSSLPNPRKVVYDSTPPRITNLKQQTAVIFGREKAPSSDDFLEKFLKKSRIHNKDEREWRCLELNDDQQDAADPQFWYSNNKFANTELKAVYLGLATTKPEKEALINLVKAKYPRCKIYQAEKTANDYNIGPYSSCRPPGVCIGKEEGHLLIGKVVFYAARVGI